MSRSLIVAALLCFLASPGFAQDGRKVVHAGRMIDVISGKTLADRAIWIDGERIERIDAWSTAAPGITVIDWSDYTLSLIHI